MNSKQVPRIPSFLDPEVTAFHPVVEKAITQALNDLGFSKEYSLRHHYKTGSGIADFVLVNNATERPVFPIEVKRTAAALRGEGRRQARDYQVNLTRPESSFYVTTNLEITELFYNSSERRGTEAQLIRTEATVAGSLPTPGHEQSPEDALCFFKQLVDSFREIILIIVDKRNFRYHDDFYQLSEALAESGASKPRWEQLLLPISYELVRSLTNPGLPSALALANNPRQLSFHLQPINYSLLIDSCVPNPRDRVAFNTPLLQGISNRVVETSLLPELSSLIFQQVSDGPHISPGVVETDHDLSKLLTQILIKHETPKEGWKILDPSAGTGRLLIDFIDAIKTLGSDSSIQPRDIVAVELDYRFKEVLALNLGLSFGKETNRFNSPEIIIGDFALIDEHVLDGVNAVLINPPFGVAARDDLVAKYSRSLKESTLKHTKRTSQLDNSSGIEELFIENVVERVASGTIICAILPSKILANTSERGQKFRNYLVSSFGLTDLFFYPMEGLFASWRIDTAIFIGKTKPKSLPDKIRVHQTVLPVSDIFDDRQNYLAAFESSCMKVSSRDETTWKQVLVSKNTVEFINTLRGECKSPLKELVEIRRGSYGNQGLARELRIQNKGNLSAEAEYMMPLQNNARNLSRFLDASNTDSLTFDPNLITPLEVQGLIFQEQIEQKGKAGTQKKNRRSDTTRIQTALRLCQRFLPGQLLIPRGQRAKGEISMISPGERCGIAISTNFVTVKAQSIEDNKLIGSWLLSVFGQLLLEYFGKSEAGMRKHEVHSIGRIPVPNLQILTNNQRDRLVDRFDDAVALDFCNLDPVFISSSALNKEWASILFQKEPSESLRRAVIGLQELIRLRDPCPSGENP